MSSMTYSGQKPLIAGVGMLPFMKPGQSEPWDKMGEAAARLALQDAEIRYEDLELAYVGYVYADSTAGQSALYHLGLSGIPIINVNNNCATGSTALFLACQAVSSGSAEVALAVGFEQMNPGKLGLIFDDRKRTLDWLTARMGALLGEDTGGALDTAKYFGGAGLEHQRKFGTSRETFAKIAVKARHHAANNPFALFRTPLSVEEVLESRPLYGMLTRYQACAPSCGAAAAVVVSPSYARKHSLRGLVEVAGQAMTTDTAATFDGMIGIVGADMTRRAAEKVYEQASAGAQEVQVVELHDCFTSAEAIFSESLGLCPEGGIEKYVDDGDNTYGGAQVVNPSGGLLAKGHPLGATGLAQCYELVHQVRGTAGPRQVSNVKNALAHNTGLGGATVVTMFRGA
ncbi:MAG: tioL [Gammaproteobacteria bacterium]|nr:tioL [Gammaproteobacteria bacterium]